MRGTESTACCCWYFGSILCGTPSCSVTIEQKASDVSVSMTSAACVATAEKLELNRFNSFSRSCDQCKRNAQPCELWCVGRSGLCVEHTSIVRCFTVERNKSLSAASIQFNVLASMAR